MKTLAAFAIWLTGIAAWITAVVTDGGNDEFGWMVVDILISPFGVIRGFLMWLGAV